MQDIFRDERVWIVTCLLHLPVMRQLCHYYGKNMKRIKKQKGKILYDWNANNKQRVCSNWNVETPKTLGTGSIIGARLQNRLKHNSNE